MLTRHLVVQLSTLLLLLLLSLFCFVVARSSPMEVSVELSTAELQAIVLPYMVDMLQASGVLQPNALLPEISLLGLKFCSPVLKLQPAAQLRLVSPANQLAVVEVVQPWILQGEKKTLHGWMGLEGFKVDDWQHPIAAGDLLVSASPVLPTPDQYPLLVHSLTPSLSLVLRLANVRLVTDLGAGLPVLGKLVHGEAMKKLLSITSLLQQRHTIPLTVLHDRLMQLAPPNATLTAVTLLTAADGDGVRLHVAGSNLQHDDDEL